MRGCLLHQLPLRLGAVYVVEVDCKAGRAGVSGWVLLGGEYLRVRSSEMLPNVCRTVRWINSLASKGMGAAGVSRSGRVRVGLPAHIVYNNA